MPVNLAIICGPKSPTTTKYVTHVPIKNPITHNSAVNLPDGPNTYDAAMDGNSFQIHFFTQHLYDLPINSRFLRRALIDVFMR